MLISSMIKILHTDGSIEDVVMYTLEPFKALVCYIEQYINKNHNTWQYNFDSFIGIIKELSSGKGYVYDMPDGTAICAYEK